MTANSRHVESNNGASARGGLLHAFAAAMGLAAICAAPAMSAEWDLATPGPGLRMPDSLLSLREMYPDLPAPRAGSEFTREFRPRASVLPAPSPDADFRGSIALDKGGKLPLTSAWERMADFRSADGIRLLTVWQSTDSTLAVHQGKHGGASLEWTSHALNRGGASRGLFDHLVSTVRDTHSPVRSTAPGAPALSMPVAPRSATP
jgi:hypothetical protein